jgi:hypothetical protein
MITSAATSSVKVCLGDQLSSSLALEGEVMKVSRRKGKAYKEKRRDKYVYVSVSGVSGELVSNHLSSLLSTNHLCDPSHQ